jgi:hypothetical protein
MTETLASCRRPENTDVAVEIVLLTRSIEILIDGVKASTVPAVLPLLDIAHCALFQTTQNDRTLSPGARVPAAGPGAAAARLDHFQFA